MKTRPGRQLGSFLFALLVASLAHSAIYYVESVTTTDLGTLGGDRSSATDINNRGDIVGYAKDAGMERFAVRWHAGVIQELGTPATSAFSYAMGINDLGEIVGMFGDPGGFEYRPFFWTLGTGMVEMDRSLFPGDPLDPLYIGKAFAINNSGMIAGVVEKDFTTFTVPCRKSLPAIWDNAYAASEIVHCAEDIGSYNRASDINNSGWIAGSEGDGSGPTYGFVWKSGITTHIPNPFFGNEVDANGINEAGVIVGSAKILGVSTRAIIWDGVSATSTWLPVLAGGSVSHATEVNDQNFVSGTSEMLITHSTLPSQVRNRAYIWHTGLGMYRLPVTPGLTARTTDCYGNSLNNRVSSTGVIKVVGACGPRAVLWTVVVKKG